MTIRIVLADDHLLFRRGLCALLAAEPDLEVVAEAGNGHEAIAAVLTHRPDVVLMNLSMPELDGLAATLRVRDLVPEAKVIIVSGREEDQVVVAVARAGAIGYIRKTAPVQELVRTIHAAARGEVTFSTAASARLLQELQRPPEQPEHLTARELEVLRNVAHGRSNKEIAWALHISEKTVKTHVSTILGKFGLESRTQAALHATRLGLVPDEQGGTSVQAPAHGHAIVSLASRRAIRGPLARSAAHAAG
jgi:DNA-binding NarL/FixJ family response regulator